MSPCERVLYFLCHTGYSNDVHTEVFYVLLMLCRRHIDFSLKGASATVSKFTSCNLLFISKLADAMHTASFARSHVYSHSR